jgi:transmembrane sensor
MSSVNQQIDSKAAGWAAKRNLGELTPGEAAEFEAWLAADIRHLGAYGRAEAVLARLERIPGSAIGEVRARPDEDAAVPLWNRRRIVLTGGIAASIAGIGIVATALWRNNQSENIATGIGQMREVVLADGSVLTLNTSSRVSVRFTDERREVYLLQGEALFDVAKNKHRPFIVHAGDIQVRAVGTSFTVSMLPQRPIQVLVREGVVELKRNRSAAPVRVSANTKALASFNTSIIAAGVPEAKLERDLAWKYGQIAFDNQTLQDAAEEFARYSDVRIVVDPSIANRTVTGLFVSNDPIGFAKAAAAVLRLQVEVNDREVKLSGK